MTWDWDIGAPTGIHCCGPHDFDKPVQATWTLLNPVDGGPPLHYCDDCKEERNEGYAA